LDNDLLAYSGGSLIGLSCYFFLHPSAPRRSS
jgi:hypothetical protein